MMKTNVAVFLVLCVGVALLVCGCSSDYVDPNGNWQSGSYEGTDTTLSSGANQVNVTDVTGGFEDADVEPNSKGGGTFHFWANADGSPVQMAGTYTVNGATITVSATTVSGVGARQAGDGITMNLTITADTAMAGDITYIRGGDDYTGEIDFTRYPNQ